MPKCFTSTVAIIATITPIWSAMAANEITVTLTTVGGSTSSFNRNSGDAIDINASNNLAQIWIRTASPSAHDVGRVRLLDPGSSGTQLIQVYVSANVQGGTGFVSPGCRHFDGFECTRKNVSFKGSINGDLTGGILASQLIRLNAVGTILGPITSGVDDTDSGGPCIVVAGSVGSTGSVVARAGNVSLVQSTSGSILGRIESETGQIGTVESALDIGSSTTPVDIHASNTINSITARDVFADIDPRTENGSVDGVLNNFVATRDVGGGLIKMEAFTTFRIGRSLLASGTVSVRNGTLTAARQIFINYNNDGGQWLGTVRTGIPAGGGVNLSPVPQYDQLSSLLSGNTQSEGGAAGEVPFHIHGADSTPTDGSNVLFASLPLSTVEVDFYGPVKWTGSAPFIVERRVQGQSTWVAFYGSCVGSATGSGTRIAAVDVSDVNFLNGYEYRVRPVRTGGDAVRCDLGGGSDPIVADDATIFTVGNTCVMDLNGDGEINGADLSVLLFRFEDSDVCGIAGDVNNDNTVNGADLSVLLSRFGTSCDTESLRGSIGLLDDLGFASVEAYAGYVQSLSPSQLQDHLALLLELVNQ